MDVFFNEVKCLKLSDEKDGVRILTIETEKGDSKVYLRKSCVLKRLNLKRQRKVN